MIGVDLVENDVQQMARISMEELDTPWPIVSALSTVP